MKAFFFAVAAIATANLNAQQPGEAAPAPKQIAIVRVNMNVEGQSFRKGESFVVEKIDKVTAAAETTRNGRKYRVPLQSVDIQEAPAANAGASATPVGSIVIIKAQYGPPGARQSNVANRVRNLAAQTPPGESPVILVSEALRGGAANRTDVSQVELSGQISQTGSVDLNGTITAAKKPVLTVTYSVNGISRTAQGEDGQRIILK